MAILEQVEPLPMTCRYCKIASTDVYKRGLELECRILCDSCANKRQRVNAAIGYNRVDFNGNYY